MVSFLTRRRHNVLLVAGLVPVGLTGCATLPVEGIMSASSLLALSKDAVKGVGYGMIGNYGYDEAKKQFAPADQTEVEQAAKSIGSDPGLATLAAKDLGKDVVLDALKGGVAIWYQFNSTNLDVNRFKIELTNLTNQEIRGQLELGIYNEAGNLEANPIKSRQYLLYPKDRSQGQPLVLNLTYSGNFKTPGKKVIRVLRHWTNEKESEIKINKVSVLVYNKIVQYS